MGRQPVKRLKRGFNGLTIIYLLLATLLIVVTGMGANSLKDYIDAPLWGRWIAFGIIAAFFWFALKGLNILEARVKRKFAKRKDELVAEGDVIRQERAEVEARNEQLQKELEDLPEVEISEATKARLQKRIDNIKAGKVSVFDPSELEN